MLLKGWCHNEKHNLQEPLAALQLFPKLKIIHFIITFRLPRSNQLSDSCAYYDNPLTLSVAKIVQFHPFSPSSFQNSSHHGGRSY